MIIELHRRFCDLLPPDLLFAEHPQTKERIPVIPGELRTSYVKVGQHVAISPGAIPRFLERLHQAYQHTDRIETVLAATCAHRSEAHTSELQYLMRTSYAVFCLKKTKTSSPTNTT